MGTQLKGTLNRVQMGIIPDELAASNNLTGLMLPPPDVTVALTAAAPAASPAQNLARVQTIAVAALTGPIGKGTCLPFLSGVGAATVLRRVTLLEHAKTGDTSLSVYPLILPIAATATARHVGMYQLKGGTKAEWDTSAEDKEVMTFTEKLEDEPETGEDGFATGQISKKSWKISYTALMDPTDIGYERMANAGATGESLRVFVRLILPKGPGFDRGERYEGVADVLGWKLPVSAESYVEINTEFKGRGGYRRIAAVQAA